MSILPGCLCLSIPNMTDQELIKSADNKTKDMVSYGSDLKYREKLIEELKKRNIEYPYDNIMRGRYVSFAKIK